MQAAMRFINVDLEGLLDHAEYLSFCQKLEDLLARFHAIHKIHLSASSLGSPFFTRFVQRFKSRGLQLFCVSNGVWEQEQLLSLWEAPLDVLGFWVESTHRETQEILRPGEDLEQIFVCFQSLKEKNCSTKTVFYTNLLEQNLNEISRLYSFVEHHPWIDHLLLQVCAPQTPKVLQRFRDIGDLKGDFAIEVSPSLLNFLWKKVSDEAVLLNPMEQIALWKQLLELNELEQKKSLLLKCAQGVPFAVLSHRTGLQYHCPRYNSKNLYFHSDEFLNTAGQEIENCSDFCHFRWNYVGQNHESNPEGYLKKALVL